MTTWIECINVYSKIFATLDKYTNERFPVIKDDTALKNISVHILEKFHINLNNSLHIMLEIQQRPLDFLSLGLIFRGMLSDIINYRYLHFIYEHFGQQDFENEVLILELDFAGNYKSIVDSEKVIGGADETKMREIDAKFFSNFAKFYSNGTKKKAEDFRVHDFRMRVNDYAAKNNINLPNRLETEWAKILLVNDQYTEHVKIAYNYLAVFQHFSGSAYNFYKNEDYLAYNPNLAAIQSLIVIDTIVKIIKVMSPGDAYIPTFIEIGVIGFRPG